MDGTRDESQQGRGQTKAETRARLLEAARDVFVATGYRGATLDAIAGRAGFTKGALYWHFPNKQALFLALVSDSIDANFARIEALLEKHGDDPDVLRTAVGAYVDAIDEGEALPIFGVELEIEARGDDSFRALHRRLIEQHEATIAKFLDHYFRATNVAPPMPLDQLTATLVALFKGFALSRHNRQDMPVGSASAVRLFLGLPT
jgi:AcrR family transcriptional regulator